MAPKQNRDNRGRFSKGCSYTRNHKTGRCRSQREYHAAQRRAQKIRRTAASRKISGAVAQLKKKVRYDSTGTALHAYKEFLA